MTKNETMRHYSLPSMLDCGYCGRCDKPNDCPSCSEVAMVSTEKALIGVNTMDAYDKGFAVRDMGDLQDMLEGLVDGHEIAVILSSLADVCYEKATHLEENWGEVGSSAVKTYYATGDKINKLALKLDVPPLVR